MAQVQLKNPPQLGVVRGKGTSTSDSIPAKLSKDEVVLNAGAAQALKKMLGKQSIAQFNAEYSPKGANTEFKGGVLHAAKGDPIPAPAPVVQPLLSVPQQNPVYKNTQPISSAPTVENAASGAQTQRNLDNAQATQLNTTYPAYNGQNAIVGGSNPDKLANLVPDDAKKAARHAALAEQVQAFKGGIRGAVQDTGQMIKNVVQSPSQVLLGPQGIKDIEGTAQVVGENVASGLSQTGQAYNAGAKDYGFIGGLNSIRKAAFTNNASTDTSTPQVTDKPTPTVAQQSAPEQAKPTVNTTTQANTSPQVGGTPNLRTRRSVPAPDAWNQGGAGNVERQSKVIAPGLLAANTKGTYDPQSGQSFIVGANGQKQWLPPKDEFAPKGTPQQQIYLAGLSPAEREARGGYANMQQVSGNPDQEAASQHYLLGNQGRNSPVLDLTGGNVYKGPMKRTTPLKVTPWNNPMTDANMQDFTPDYIKAAGDVQQGKEENSIKRAELGYRRDTLAEDKRQFDLGGQTKAEKARYSPDDIAATMDTASPLSELSAAQDVFTNPRSKGYKMAQQMQKDIRNDPQNEGQILEAFAKASGITRQNLISILRYTKNQ